MNYEISGSYISELSSRKLNIKLFLLLILSVVFIPAAYIFVAAVFTESLVKGRVSLKPINKLHILVYAYLLIGLLSSDYKLISCVYVIIMLLCLYSYTIFKDSISINDIYKLRNLVFTVSLIVFLFGIMQYFNPDFAMPSKWVDAGEYKLNKRIYSTFFNPNIFGFYINLIIIFATERLDLKKINLNNSVFLSGLICSILTFSRTSWLSLILALFVASLLDKKYIRYALIVSIAIFSADTLLGIGRADPLKAVGDSSFLYRLEVWKTSIEIIKDNFFSGIGFGTLFMHVGEYSTVVSTKIEHSHNLYLQIFTETGILGFSIFIIIILNVLKKFKRKLIDEKSKIWVSAFAVFVMTMVHGLVDSVALTPQIMMLLAMYAGTIDAMNNEH
ncbi:MAG: O-antigen ligase family protein [Sedimentibacter sp.]